MGLAMVLPSKVPVGVTLRPEPVAVALGSNPGNSLATLTWAVSALKPMAERGGLRCSPWFRSAAMGGPPNQPDYINGVVLLHCSGSPMVLLQRLQALERQAGHQPSLEPEPGPHGTKPVARGPRGQAEIQRAATPFTMRRPLSAPSAQGSTRALYWCRPAS